MTTSGGAGGGHWFGPRRMFVQRHLTFSRFAHTAVLLATGFVLVTGGTSPATGAEPPERAQSELFEPTTALAVSQRPTIGTIPPLLRLGSALTVTGGGFTGPFEASGGNGGQHSPTNYPLIMLRSLSNDQQAFVPLTGWSAGSLTTRPILRFPLGPALATVVVRGALGAPVLITIQPRLAASPTSDEPSPATEHDPTP